MSQARLVLPVLMYHSIPKETPGNTLAVPWALLDRQWRALRADGWTLRGLTEALALTETAPRILGVTFDDGYADFLSVPELLSAHDARATLYLPTSQLGESWSSTGIPYQSLSWDDVAALPRDLVEIGSHAHIHRPLDVLSQLDLDYEVRYSRQVIAERTGVQATSFCYPNGYCNHRVRSAVSAAGYLNACIVGRKLADPGGDPYAVPRLQVTHAHDEAGIIALVAHGEPGLTPQLKRAAQPSWRGIRKVAYRATGRFLTLCHTC